MPRFYLHIYNGSGVAEDLEGQELADTAAARRAAIEGLRDILASELRGGKLDTASFVEIEDEARHPVATVSFDEAVRITDETPRRT